MVNILKFLIFAIIGATILQLPLSYILASRESLFLGLGFLSFDDKMISYLGIVVFVSFIITVVLGLPCYFALKHRKWNNVFSVLAVGALIPLAIILGVELLAPNSIGFSANENFYGYVRSIIDAGQRTSWGWIKLFEQFIVFGLHGCLGALTFHRIFVKGSDA